MFETNCNCVPKIVAMSNNNILLKCFQEDCKQCKQKCCLFSGNNFNASGWHVVIVNYHDPPMVTRSIWHPHCHTALGLASCEHGNHNDMTWLSYQTKHINYQQVIMTKQYKYHISLPTLWIFGVLSMLFMALHCAVKITSIKHPIKHY